MVRRFLIAGVAGIMLAAPAQAVDATQGAVAMLVAQEVCPAGTVEDERLADTLEIAAIESGKPLESLVLEIALRSISAKERLLRIGSVDAFCRDLATALAPRIPGN